VPADDIHESSAAAWIGRDYERPVRGADEKRCPFSRFVADQAVKYQVLRLVGLEADVAGVVRKPSDVTRSGAEA
jgi:hypothetical protein